MCCGEGLQQRYSGRREPDAEDAPEFTALCDEYARTKCLKHPRYAGKRRPTGNCEKCWRIYIEKNPTT